MELIERTDCPFCWKVRLALAVYSIPYVSTPTTLSEKHPKVLQHNPKASVPVLIDADNVLWESTVMLEYLNDQYADGALYAGTAAERARTRSLVAYSDGVVGPALRDLVFERRSKPADQCDPQVIAKGLENWGRVQHELDAMLGDRDYFGKGFSAADCALLARLGVAEAYAAGPSSAVVHLRAWFDRLRQHEAWSMAYPSSFIRPST